MLKDQPVFCDRLKILTTEGLPESHFHFQFPSSGFSAIKNLKEPQREVRLSHIQMIMSNCSASGEHWLYFPTTRRWQRPLGAIAALRSRLHRSAQRVPGRHHLCAQTPSPARPAPGAAVSWACLWHSPRDSYFLRLHFVISRWTLQQLSPHWQSLLNPLTC